jgi:hypothetical protein
MQHEFLPAIVPYVVDERPWMHPIHYLDPSTPEIYYGKVLLSYFHWQGFEVKWKGQGQTIFGDSGGYSVVTGGAQIDPEEVIRWQLANCTRGVMLDIPPYRPSSSIQFTGSAAEWWAESMQRTRLNVERAFRIYSDAQIAAEMAQQDLGFGWWGCIQGESRDQMQEWYEMVSAIYPFNGWAADEGWALAPKPSTDLLSCTRYLRFAHDHGLRRVHFLQVTSPSVVAVVLGLAELSGEFDLITYDSASAVRNAINRGGVVLDDVDFKYMKQKGNHGEITDLMSVCACQACRWYREDLLRKDTVTERFWDAEFTHRIALHNHLIMVEGFQRIGERAQADPEWLIRHAAGKLYGQVMREWEKTHSESKSQLQSRSIFDCLL